MEVQHSLKFLRLCLDNGVHYTVINLVNKVFGNLVYDKSMSTYKMNYQIMDLKSSIKITEDK